MCVYIYIYIYSSPPESVGLHHGPALLEELEHGGGDLHPDFVINDNINISTSNTI